MSMLVYAYMGMFQNMAMTFQLNIIILDGFLGTPPSIYEPIYIYTHNSVSIAGGTQSHNGVLCYDGDITESPDYDTHKPSNI